MLCSSKIQNRKQSSLKETGYLDTTTLPVFDVNQRQSSFKDQWVGILMLCSSKIKDQKPSSLKETGNLDTKTLPVFDIYQRQSSFKDQWDGILMLCSSKIQNGKQSSLKETWLFLQKLKRFVFYASHEAEKKKWFFLIKYQFNCKMRIHSSAII